jgi:hypothetical protein
MRHRQKDGYNRRHNVHGRMVRELLERRSADDGKNKDIGLQGQVMTRERYELPQLVQKLRSKLQLEQAKATMLDMIFLHVVRITNL